MLSQNNVQATSSDSDHFSYKSVCLKASLDQETFNVFKQIPEYTEILEGYPYEVGQSYLEEIENKFPLIYDKINDFKDNDKYGGPLCFNYPKIGVISPATLGYIFNAANMLEYFGDLNNKSILEIGGGYGGQSFILSKMINFKYYHIYDLAETSLLINKYLSLHKVTNACAEQIALEVNPLNYDLLISNYAFSECSREMQDEYFNKVIPNVKSGYMILNFSERSYSHEEIVFRLENMGFNVEIYTDIPKGSPLTKRIIFRKIG